MGATAKLVIQPSNSYSCPSSQNFTGKVRMGTLMKYEVTMATTTASFPYKVMMCNGSSGCHGNFLFFQWPYFDYPGELIRTKRDVLFWHYSYVQHNDIVNTCAKHIAKHTVCTVVVL